MRQDGQPHSRGNRAPRRVAAALLTIWLVASGPLCLAPPVRAAPPETPPADAAPPIAPDATTAATPPDGAASLLAPETAPGADTNAPDFPLPAVELPADGGSVRRRGLEAPVELQERAPATEPPAAADPGDGVPRGSRARERGRPAAIARRNENRRAEEPARIWPLPPESYTFSQAFGCVQQLGNLYFADPDCPPSAPVVHTGVDLAAPEGTPFYAAASGWVTLAGFDRPTPDANTRIIIQHDGENDGYATEYLHWVATFVEVGDYVRAGQPIGEVGNVGFSTGPHLHFSVVDLETGEHVDPVRWLPEDPASGSYPGRLPSATFRLPAGTTAGYPEGADPSPPPPPRREKVPDSPPGERARDGKHGGGHKHQGDKSRPAKDDAGAGGSKNKKHRKAKSDSGAESSHAEDSAKRSERDRTRTRERHRDGATSSQSDEGASTENSENSDRRNTRERRTEKPNDGERSGGQGNTKHERKDRSDEQGTRSDRGSHSGEGGNGRHAGGDRQRRQDAQADGSEDTTASSDAANNGESTGGDRQRDERRGRGKHR